MKHVINYAGLSLLACLLTLNSQGQNGPSCDTYQNNNSFIPTSVYATGNMVYVATNGGLRISSDGGNTFTNKTMTNGLGSNQVSAVFTTGNTVYAGIYNLGGFGPPLGGVDISTDGGNTFTIHKGPGAGLGDIIVNSIYAVGNTVYAGTGSPFTNSGGLSISTDGGNTFSNKTTANGLGYNTVHGVYAIGSTVYAATSIGLSISTNGGTSFTNKTITDGLGSNFINSVYAVGNTIYTGTSGGLSISTDGGASFTNKTITNGLGSNTVNSVYAIGNTVYAATSNGLSISTDGGNTFSNKTTSNGLGGNNTSTVGATGAKIYVGTNGGLSSCQNTALPVQLVNFSVQPNLPERVQLNWQTTHETDNAYFQIERSTDLSHIESLDKVTASEANEWQIHSYYYTDEHPYRGTSYYRLLQVDNSGNSKIYPWVSVVLDRQAYGVYPNPIINNRFTLHLDEPSTAGLRLYNVSGQQLALDRMNLQGHDLVLKTSHPLLPGVYVLEAAERAQVRTHRLVVE